MPQLKKFPDIPVSTREEARESRPHPEEPVSASGSKGGVLSLRGRERIPGVPVATQEEALSTGKTRGTPGSGPIPRVPLIYQSIPGKPVFPALPRLLSQGSTHTTVARGTALWGSLVGKPRGKASRESHRSVDPREGKRDTAATAREESARACPHSSRGLTASGDSRSTPRYM